MDVYFSCMYAYARYVCSVLQVRRGSKILALQVVVSYHVGVQGIIKPWSSGRVTSTLNHEVILSHYYIFKDI